MLLFYYLQVDDCIYSLYLNYDLFVFSRIMMGLKVSMLFKLVKDIKGSFLRVKFIYQWGQEIGRKERMWVFSSFIKLLILL